MEWHQSFLMLPVLYRTGIVPGIVRYIFLFLLCDVSCGSGTDTVAAPYDISLEDFGHT